MFRFIIQKQFNTEKRNYNLFFKHTVDHQERMQVRS